MASIQETLRSVLGADLTLLELVEGHIYPGELPDDSAEPLGLYYATPEEAPFDELDPGDTSDVNAEVEFHSFAPTYAQAEAIINAVIACLDTHTGGQVSAAFWRGTSRFVEDVGYHHVARFQVWGNVANIHTTQGGRSRIITGADSITLTAGAHTLLLSSDGLLLDGVNFTSYARKDLANTFTAVNTLSHSGVSLVLRNSVTGFRGIEMGHFNTYDPRVYIYNSVNDGVHGFFGQQSGIDGAVFSFNALHFLSPTFINTAGQSGRLFSVVNSAEQKWFQVNTDASTSLMGPLNLFGASSITNDRNRATLSAEVVDNTDATRKYRFTLSAWDTLAREVMRGEADGSAAKVGFLGAAAITRPSVTGSRGGNAALASLLTAGANLGLWTDNTTA